MRLTLQNLAKIRSAIDKIDSLQNHIRLLEKKKHRIRMAIQKKFFGNKRKDFEAYAETVRSK